MKKSLPVLLLFVLLSGCAEKNEVFDPAAAFSTAEQSMQKGDYGKARKAYQEIQEKAPEKSYDPAVMLRIADTYFGEEKYEEAFVEYQAFLNYHPANKSASYAQFQLALCSYNQLSTIDRDPELTRAALREFQALLRKYPGSSYEEQAKAHVTICLDRLAQYEFYVARFYQKKGSFRAAIGRFERLLADYPGSSVEKDSLYEVAVSYLNVGEGDRAKAKLDLLAQRYPSMADRAALLMAKLGTKSE
jgi:outer membrane protein assembly factor BamD